MIWQYSPVTWVLIGVFVTISPWVLDARTRAWAVPLACAPILYGIIGNFLVTRGRHFGWMTFATIIVAAALVAQA